jgi:hypothetical protein
MAFGCRFCGIKLYLARDPESGRMLEREARNPDHPPHNCSVENMIWFHEHRNEWATRKFLNSLKKLQRKEDDSGWNRFNLDGTAHVDKRKGSSSTAQNTSQLETKIDTLIVEVRSLREEIAGKYKHD